MKSGSLVCGVLQNDWSVNTVLLHEFEMDGQLFSVVVLHEEWLVR